jgi:hypothetical protein
MYPIPETDEQVSRQHCSMRTKSDVSTVYGDIGPDTASFDVKHSDSFRA